MIDRQRLLSDLQTLLRTVEADLRARSEDAELPEVSGWLKTEYESAKEAGRTAQTLKSWVDDFVTQVAAAWVLSCVFVRYLEDNALVDPPRIAGPASDAGGGQSRLKRARDEYDHWVQNNRGQTDREYLLDIFSTLAALPAAGEVFGPHNPVNALPNWLSGDAARAMLGFFQKVDADTGEITHDFTDPSGDTRFLGDLYQDLSEAARKKYALLQTPDFVEEFILDRTLEPALDEFGLTPQQQNESGSPRTASGRGGVGEGLFRMIDPACGSGHFLLGAFPRILDRWQKKEPGEKTRVLVQRALDSIHGVDVNPYAIAIARFRLLLAALAACDCKKLKDAPKFEINLACGDSLWHAPLRGNTGSAARGQQELPEFSPEADSESQQHTYFAEDAARLQRILAEGRYHCVVANPPYIVPKDRALNQDYRARYASCHMKYSLAVPFMERIFRLALAGRSRESGVGSDNPQASTLTPQVSGFTGQITANSFMKREFGKKLIEEYLPTIDLTHVIDTSGAYIPGHGTPTTILFGRNRAPIASTIRTVMGIKGEPATPDNPADGLVWTAIVDQVDQPGSESEFVSAGDSERDRFGSHPWSIGGGGAAELKEQLEEHCVQTLNDFVTCIGFSAILGEDEGFGSPVNTNHMRKLKRELVRPIVEGEKVRDWSLDWESEVLFPYDDQIKLLHDTCIKDWLWPIRSIMFDRKDFSRATYRECGRPFWEYHQIPIDRNRIPLSVVYAEVATHNHFVLDRGGKVFKQTAPVIKLPAEMERKDGSRRPVTEDDHLALLGLLNSSTACFWMKQVCHNKGSTVDQRGARQRTAPFEDFYAFNATKLKELPVPANRPLEVTRVLDELSHRIADCNPENVVKQHSGTVAALRNAERTTKVIQSEMVDLQESLDWLCYELYGLIEEDLSYPTSTGTPPTVRVGERAFEIVMARKMAAGELETTWFERHGSAPITELPEHWPDDYKALVNRRIEIIESDPNIALIEQPEYKRRWNTEPWESQVERALQSWLLDRLESYFDFDGRMNPNESGSPRAASGRGAGGEGPTAHASLTDPRLISIAQLADIAASDEAFMEVGSVYRDDPAFNVPKLVEELVKGEHVPLLPILRYKPAGLRKREQWEETWELQRQEDRINAQRAALTSRINVRQEEYKHGSEETQAKPREQQEALLSTCQSINKTQPDSITFNDGDDIEAYCEEVLSKGFDGKYAALAMLVNDHRKAIKETKKQQRLEYQAACVADEELQSWERERKALPPIPDIPVPPKYKSSDFISTGGARYWALRGKLDVPKERWISFPHCPGNDGTLIICWAGYDHLQQALAIAGHYQTIKEDEGGVEDPRLIPLLACLAELLPWLKQWHSDIDPTYGMSMSDYFDGFLTEEARALNQTLEEIKAWQPPARTTRRRTKTS